MAQLKINGTTNLVTGDITSQGVLTTTVTLSSDNNITNNITINSGSWTQIDKGDTVDLRYLYASNNNVTASVLICENTSSIQYKAILQPSDTLLLPFSGSVTLYAKSVSESPAKLQYILCQS